MQNILYTEPALKGSDLMSAELISTALYSNTRAFSTDRYFDNKALNIKSNYESFGGELNYDLDGVVKQFAYLPQQREDEKENYIKLSFTPPIKELRLNGIYDFYYGDAKGDKQIFNFPFGFIIAAEARVAFSYYFDESCEGLALGANVNSELVNREIGKNIFTYDAKKTYKKGKYDSFCVIVLGLNMAHEKTLFFKKLPHSLNKFSFNNGNFFAMSYDFSKRKIAFVKNNKILYDLEFAHATYLRFFRTKNYDIAYTNNEIFIFNKQSEVLIRFDFKAKFDGITFNPILKSICTKAKDKYSVYRIFGDEVYTQILDNELNEAIKPYAVAWAGNLEYDYLIKDIFGVKALGEYVKSQGGRGHNLARLGEHLGDFNYGLFYKSVDNFVGFKDDFYLNNTDDGDIGVSEFLKLRREITKFGKINLSAPSYARCFRLNNQLIFYSNEFNNDFGKLIIFSF